VAGLTTESAALGLGDVELSKGKAERAGNAMCGRCGSYQTVEFVSVAGFMDELD